MTDESHVAPPGFAIVGYIIGSAEELERGGEWVDCRAIAGGEFRVPVYRAIDKACPDEMRDIGGGS